MDIALNKNFDIFLDDTNDLAIVEGREAFEQRLAVGLTFHFHELVGSTDPNNLVKMLRVRARRIVERAPEVVSVADLQIEISEEQPNTVDVTVVYETGDDVSFQLTE